jgi:protein-L-isoaspartate O-methyltransferase
LQAGALQADPPAPTMMDRISQLRNQLAAELVSMRAIRSPEWRGAFERVPRHVFVPRFTVTEAESDRDTRTLDSAVGEQSEQWLAAVYSDAGLITQFTDGYSTSSSSRPSIMAPMLEALDAGPGQKVLEIGTGTGYDAALLCERVGWESITTIDIDAELVGAARERLREAGYTPTVAVADGYSGYPENAPNDRVIGTCFVWPLPIAWIAQTRAGGRVVAVVPDGLVQLTVADDRRSASGPFHGDGFGFMSMQGGHMPRGVPMDEAMALVGQGGTTRSCRLPHRITEAGTNWSFWFFWGLLLAPFAEALRPERGVLILIDEVDRSWLRLDRSSNEVTQGGPRLLWDEIERLFETWCHLGAPNREHLGLTVTVDGRHILWLDSPDSGQTWELAR